ncbi:hypothetical protein ACFL4A_02320 [bacterium]
MKYKILLIFFTFLICPLLAQEKNAFLTIDNFNEIYLQNTNQGADPNLKNKNDIQIIGKINLSNFAIMDLSNIELLDPNGKKVKLTIDKSSIYSEFDDEIINSIKISFITIKDTTGDFRLTWGKKVSSKNNIVPTITLYSDNVSQYRSFSLTASENIDALSYSATIEVIVDNYADKYYLWYLLPIILIFILLFFRRHFR